MLLPMHVDTTTYQAGSVDPPQSFSPVRSYRFATDWTVSPHYRAFMYKISIVRLVGDFLLLALFGIALLVLDKVPEAFHRGLYCDDDSLRYPYKPDTISRLLCAVVGGGICLSLIIIFEILRIFVENREFEDRVNAESTKYTLCNKPIHRIFPRLWLFMGFYLFGAVADQFIADIGKFTIGRLRPHFWDVCLPDQATIDKCGIDQESQRHVYVDNITCTRAGWEHEVHDARLSFPSGHSAFSFYSMIFAILYLQARVYWPLASRLGRPLIQVLCLCWAIYVALSRISDYKHHWSDVLAGSLLGTFVAVIVCWPIGRFFERRELPPDWHHGKGSGAPGDELLLDVHCDNFGRDCQQSRPTSHNPEPEFKNTPM